MQGYKMTWPVPDKRGIHVGWECGEINSLVKQHKYALAIL